MPRVTSIQPLGRNDRKVAVTLEDGEPFTVSAGVVREHGLLVGQELASGEVAGILQRDQQAEAMVSVLRLLELRPRSEAELRKHLARRRFERTVVESTVVRLKELGYLDDAAFARHWREVRERLSPRGAQTLRRELLGKGLSREIAEEAVLDGMTDEENAWRAAEQRSRRLAAADYSTFRKKITAFLEYRGFPPDVVRRTAQRAWDSREAGAE